MGITVSGVDEFILRLKQTGDRVERGVSKEIQSGAEEIAALAKDYAPVDHGNLEDAIKAESDRTGKNGRIQAFVYIDGSEPAADGGTVGDYIVPMHEQLAPYGTGLYQLGFWSQMKRDSGKDVGGKFLERAAAKLAPGIIKRIKTAVRKAIN